MVNKSGRIGTAGESGVCKYLAANGFPLAERRRLRGNLDGGDLVTVPGLVVEVKSGAAAKNASVERVSDWLGETEQERLNAGANIGLLVVQRRGYSPDRAGFWRAIMPIGQWVSLFGYEPKTGLAHRPVELFLIDASTLCAAEGTATRSTTR